MITPQVATTSDALLDALLDARRVELALLDDLTDAQMLGERGHFLEPPIWEMGHVGWFQEYWLLRRLDGAEPLLPGADDIYDSFNVSYTRRWDHRFPSRASTRAYLAEVLRRSVARLQSREPRDGPRIERRDFLWRIFGRALAHVDFASLLGRSCEDERRGPHGHLQVPECACPKAGTRGALRENVRAKRGCPPPGPFARTFLFVASGVLPRRCAARRLTGIDGTGINGRAPGYFDALFVAIAFFRLS